MLLEAYPAVASIPCGEASSTLPLFLCSMKHDPPLRTMALLMKLYPTALLTTNAIGWTPLHCLVSSSESFEAVRLLHTAAPEAITMTGE